ncbi:hypothetical protein MPLA_1830242 [Mesorhizobium sp. ORS 3359]|nr:hypothetical protein MPLA_1830242 [Mesorhizobium sp. ORS 3359]
MAAPTGSETRIIKTNPEQTLSVPVVFRNRLKFNEFLKAAERMLRRTLPGCHRLGCVIDSA